jgi:predicted lipid-binding transport protein (Tim44 family)
MLGLIFDNKVSVGIASFFMGVLLTWGYCVGVQGEFATILLTLLIGVLLGVAITFFAAYKIVGHAASKLKEEEEKEKEGDDPDWWKKGKPPPY